MKTMKDLYDAEIARMNGTTIVAVPDPAHKHGAGKPVWVLSSCNAFRSTKIARQPIKSDLITGSAYAPPVGPMTSGVWDIMHPVGCQCGSGSNLVGPGHSDWCQCYKV